MKHSAPQAEWHDIEGLEVIGKGQGLRTSKDGSIHLDAKHIPFVPKRQAYDDVQEKLTITLLGTAILLGWLCTALVAAS